MTTEPRIVVSAQFNIKNHKSILRDNGMVIMSSVSWHWGKDEPVSLADMICGFAYELARFHTQLMTDEEVVTQMEDVTERLLRINKMARRRLNELKATEARP